MWNNIKALFKWAMSAPVPEEKITGVIRKKETDDAWREGTVWEEEETPKRARDKKGQYRGDDESTPDLNEAWVGGNAPSRSGLHKKKKSNKRK